MRRVFFYSVICFISNFSFSQELKKPFIISKSPTTQEKFYLVKSPYQHLDVVRKINPEFAIVGAESREEKKFKEITNNWKFLRNYAGNLKSTFYLKTKKNIDTHLKNIEILQYDETRGIAVIRGKITDIKKELLPLAHVTAVQRASRKAHTESVIRSPDLAPNKINRVHDEFPTLSGENLSVSVKEGAFDTLDLDIATRSILDSFSSSLVFSHATDMATLIVGAGNSSSAGQGVASGSLVYSEDFANLLPNSDSYFQSRKISVQNHSYGVGIENFYGLESVAFDEQAQTLPALLHVFSAGNSGTASGTEAYDGVEGFANLTGSFKQAKNVLLVTATNSNGNVPEFNSAGPAYDGRIKPELTAFGAEGTSEAAALVSGSALLIQQNWKVRESVLPSSDMVKALLIAGSDDIHNVGPDFKSGYGQLNLFHSLQAIDSGWYESEELAQGEAANFQIVIEKNLKYMNIVLAWRDPAANAGDFWALANDLDIKISKDGVDWFPWILDSSPSVSALSSSATTGVDRLNNVEMITLANVTPGTYTVEVSAFDVSGLQAYSVAYFQQAVDSFSFTYPTSSDPILANDEIVVRWESGFDDLGVLEIDYLEDAWEIVDGNISSGQQSIGYTTQDTYTQAVFRMTIGGQMFKSDTFSISPFPKLELALNCEDEKVLKWNQVSPEVEYEMRAYANGALDLLFITSDTFAIIDNDSYPQSYFSVRAVEDNLFGIRDQTLNVNAQNIGCYLNDFLLSLNLDGSINLTLGLNLPQSISNVTIRKWQSGEKETFKSFNPTIQSYQFQDLSPFVGRTFYQATLTLASGETLLSNEVKVSTTDEDTFVVFPNPVTDGNLKFLTPQKNVVLQLLDTNGNPVTDYLLTEEFTVMPVWFLPSGLYLYRILKAGETINSGRVVIRN